MEDEYKVVCAVSNSATLDDLEWPRTPVSRSPYSLKANISQTVHPIPSMFGSRLGFSVSADRMALFAVWQIQDGGWRPSWIYKNGYNFATGLPIDVMFGSRVGFSGLADLMVQLTMTLSNPEPQFKGKYLANGASDPLHIWFYAGVFGVGGSNGAIPVSLCGGAVARNPCDSWALLFYM